MNLIENLKWRYATKIYDTTKRVCEDDIHQIKEAIGLSPSSYGLQLFKVLDIGDRAIREKLRVASYGQSQIVDASHLLVFCGYSVVTDEHLDEFLSLTADTRGFDVELLEGYRSFVKDFVKGKQGGGQEWTGKQTYIALGNAMAACAELKIDSTPMEGFEADKYEKILKLSSKGLRADVLLAVGYRSAEDQTQHAPKVRKPIESLFESV